MPVNLWTKNPVDGPKGYPLLGVLPQMRRDPFGFLTSIAAQYGDAARMKLGLKTCFVLNHPEHVDHVMVKNHPNYVKSHLINKLKPVLGNGLLTSDGELWQRQRRLMQPKFTATTIQSLSAIIRNATIAKLDNLPVSSAPMDVAVLMSELTLDLIIKTMFSSDIAQDISRISEAVTILQRDISDRMWAMTDMAQYLPTAKRKQAKDALRCIDEVVNRIITARRQSRAQGQPGPSDLLDLLLNAMEENGTVDERQLRDEVVTIFAAGNETTANALSWTLSALGEHPWAADRCRQEIGTGSDAYMRLVLQESMRLRPPIWWFAREAVSDDNIMGMKIPAGAVVIISQHLLHRHPDFWTDPDQFDPERFLPERSIGRHRFAYFPFGAGPRTCIGNHMAMVEMGIVLEEILRRFTLTLTTSTPPEPEAFVTLRPRNGLWMQWSEVVAA